MIKYICYGTFSKYEKLGYRIATILETDREYYDDDTDYFYIADIELPEVDKETILNSGIKTIDNEIAALLLKVEAKRHEKQSLLAIDHKGEDNE